MSVFVWLHLGYLALETFLGLDLSVHLATTYWNETRACALLPLCMLLLVSGKPCFTDLGATAAQSLGLPIWWVRGEGTQGVS